MWVPVGPAPGPEAPSLPFHLRPSTLSLPFGFQGSLPQEAIPTALCPHLLLTSHHPPSFYYSFTFAQLFAQHILISRSVANWLSDCKSLSLSEPQFPPSIRWGRGSIVGGMSKGSKKAQTISPCSGLTGPSIPRLSQVCGTDGTRVGSPGYLMWESRCSGVWVRGDTLLVSEPTKPLSVSGDAIQDS